MVSPVGLNTSFTSAPYNQVQYNNVNNSPLNFGNNQLLSDYSDDLMMSNLNFDQIAATGQIPSPVDTSAVIPTNTVVTQPTGQVQNPDGELAGYLEQRDKNVATTENGNKYVKSNVGKTSGTILGFLAPLLGKVTGLFKGENIKNLFKFKQLAIACPVLALAGFGIGALVDGCINSKKAATADETAANNNQTPTVQIPQQLNAVA